MFEKEVGADPRSGGVERERRTKNQKICDRRFTVWRVEPAANHPSRTEVINLPSTGLASVGKVPADVRPDLRVVEVLLSRLDEFLDVGFVHAAANESWDETEEKVILVHPAELTNGEEEWVFRPSTDRNKSFLGDNVIPERWDLL